MTVIDYGVMPLAGGFLPASDEMENRQYPLSLVRCENCTLMQVPEVVAPDVIFGSYSYASSTTETLKAHFAELARYIVSEHAAAGKLVVEFGCNDGVLLRPLSNEGALVVGVDPSDVAWRASVEQGWPLIRGYFDGSTAAQVLERYGPAKIVTANNVFAHADNVHSMMEGVDKVLEEDGLFIFEVHYQGDLIRLVQFDTVYHEHLCYYSLTSLMHLLRRFHFVIVDLQFIQTHSGSIRVVAARERSGRPVSRVVGEVLKQEKSWDISSFSNRVQVRRDSLRKLVLDLKAAGKSIVAYGAAGRATVLLNYCGLGPSLIDYVVDSSPLRQGKLVPGVLVPIVPPAKFHAQAPEYALLTAWNYEAEVVAKERDFLQRGGRLIVPLPEVRLAGAL